MAGLRHRTISPARALKALLLAGCFAVLWSATALADVSIETVTVTAEKRAESILDVGINVTALTADQLTQSRVMTPTDLAAQVPNVNVKTNIPGAQQIITVRGVGLDDFSSTNNSSVGVYVDDVFLSSFAEMDFHFFDLDRIEVLKGPQGTLYGRNSTAGAINVIAAKPNFDGLSGYVSAGYGNYDTFTAQGAINVTVTDTLALRFAGQTIQQGTGYWYSRTLHRDMGRQDIFLGRGQALWQPNSALTVLLKIEGEHNNSEIGVGKFFGTISTTAAPCPDFGNPAHCIDFHGYTDTTKDPFKGDWNHLAPYKVDNFNATLHVDYDFGWARLTSVSGYVDFKREFYIDADASPFSTAEFDQNDKVRQFSQELRLAGISGPFEWLAGLYYSWDRVHSYTPGSLIDSLGTDVFIHSDQTTNSTAGFGQVRYNLTSQLSVTGGLRYTYEDRAYAGGTNLVIPTTPPVSIPVTYLKDKIFDRNWSWRGALNWKPDDDTLLYASVSRGNKSGGFFNGITFVSAALAPYRPEQLTDYEVGVKARLPYQSLLIDASAFYYDYKDLQAQTFTSVGALALIKLGNIGKASIYGLDLDVTWLPVDGLTLRAGLGLLHTQLGSFPFATGAGPVTEPAGNKLPDAPDVSFNGLARYEDSVFDGYIGAAQIEAHYADDTFKEALNTPYLFSKANWVFDGRLSLTPEARTWDVDVWAQNMFDERHVVQATDDGIGLGYRIFNTPRTYGVTLTYKFE